jgi:hypothetical protein
VAAGAGKPVDEVEAYLDIFCCCISGARVRKNEGLCGKASRLIALIETPHKTLTKFKFPNQPPML